MLAPLALISTLWTVVAVAAPSYGSAPDGPLALRSEAAVPGQEPATRAHEGRTVRLIPEEGVRVAQETLVAAARDADAFVERLERLVPDFRGDEKLEIAIIGEDELTSDFAWSTFDLRNLPSIAHELFHRTQSKLAARASEAIKKDPRTPASIGEAIGTGELRVVFGLAPALYESMPDAFAISTQTGHVRPLEEVQLTSKSVSVASAVADTTRQVAMRPRLLEKLQKEVFDQFSESELRQFSPHAAAVPLNRLILDWGREVGLQEHEAASAWLAYVLSRAADPSAYVTAAYPGLEDPEETSRDLRISVGQLLDGFEASRATAKEREAFRKLRERRGFDDETVRELLDGASHDPRSPAKVEPLF
jgi:hypothetical protein